MAVKKVDTGANHDIMSVSEREQAMLVHHERRMAIMIYRKQMIGH